MKRLQTILVSALTLISIGATALLVNILETTASAVEPVPRIQAMSVPQAGPTTILFHGGAGPFRIQTRASIDPSAPWFDLANATVVELQAGVFLAQFQKGENDLAFFRIVSEAETITDLKGWTITLQVSTPANQQYFAPGERPTITVTILDTLGQGLATSDLSTFNLYMYGPMDPLQTVTASKLLNASTNRASTPHHYINLKTSTGVQVSGRVFTYQLNAVTDEAPGTYTIGARATLAVDGIQTIIKYAQIQIRTATVETAVVTKNKCAVCHEGAISGKMYMHHIDPSRSPSGSWDLDYEPVQSCKLCHNNDGYAAIKDTNGVYIVDTIVRRVHGVHMGEGLTRDFDTNSVNGDFRDYVHGEFPADVRNCTACHADDRWKTKPSRAACGSCHDNTWFGSLVTMPAGMNGHTGGARSTDAYCSTCHPTDGIDDFGIGVVDAHKIPDLAYKNIVTLTMSPPANGLYYASGDAPQLTIQIKNAATGLPINPATIVEPLVKTNVQPNEWQRANLFVSGPRADTVPVLTTAALMPNANGYYANNDFRVRLNPLNEDPRVTRTADSIIYQLNTIGTLAPGTYTAFAEVLPQTALGGFAYINFQVGTNKVEPIVAGNCADCHGDTRMHTTSFAVTFTPDICKSCHDNLHQMSGKVGWNNSNSGFGAAPLSRRVHGVHFGKYLDKPEEVHPPYDYSEVIFPQDVRNCTKCHSESNTWTEKPSRLACLACHDDNISTTHGAMMTWDLTPWDAWNGDEIETCVVCHGKTHEYAPSKVHSISNPYVPPYPRE